MSRKTKRQKIPFLKLPDRLSEIRINLNKDKYSSINLYYQDESRFGLKTFVGRCLSVKGLRPLVKYQHRFKNTYLWGSYSPITDDQFVREIEGVDKSIFEKYLEEFSKYNPSEFKIMIIDNAKFHSTKNIVIPDNIALINIPPYTPELNPCEQVWQYIKKRYKNKTFETMEDLKNWLWDMSKSMNAELIKSITSNHRYAQFFNLIY